MRRVSRLAAAAVVALVAACSADEGAGGARPPTTPATERTVAAPTPTPPAPCSPDPNLTAAPAAPPPQIAAALATVLADPRLTATDHGASIWVEGYGEVVAVAPDRLLLPASNQKLLTAMGALAVLGPDTMFTTSVQTTAAVTAPALDGDLVLVAGGDPSLTSGGAHSLDALAAQVRASGVATITGRLVVDESRHDSARRAAGWQDWQVPTYAGSLSALMVDRNRYRRDPAFLADPALGNAEVFRAALQRHGVTVAGPTVHGTAPVDSAPLGAVTSAPVRALVAETLLRSDNMMAELLVKEAGVRAGGVGSTAAGLAAMSGALSSALCLPLNGTADDGSGLSRANLRSAREWRSLLQGAGGQPWWPLLDEALPLAGRTGTLAGRFDGTAAAGNVRAKTGSIIGGTALSGYGTTAGGRRFVFSVVANGPSAGAAEAVIDALVVAVAGDPS